MSCERSQRIYYARQSENAAVAAAFGGSAEAERALETIFAVARAQAERQLTARSGGQSRLALLREQAEDQQAEDATRVLFAEMRDRYGLAPPTHSSSGLPKKAAQYGYAAVYRTLQAILRNLALPTLAQQVRGAMWRERRTKADQQQMHMNSVATPFPVRVSPSAARGEYEGVLEVQRQKRRRLQHLQVKEAQLGVMCDASILMEMEDLREQLAELDAQVAAYAQVPTLDSPILSGEQQRAALLALAAITGLPPERIKLIDIVLGSIVLVVELPLAEAAHLLAMQQLSPQALRRSGFSAVALAPEREANAHILAQAIQEAQALLIAPDARGEMLPASGASVQLRVTLVEGAGSD